MHIKQLDLFGFKSFVDKATITFSTGICAVVGPNGCGKSNIVDAIRWAMGEQSAKQLRGKFMEEVIFSGANGRPPLNFAEVSLVLSNEDGKAPSPYHDYSEIMVTRRLFRSGESEYLINKIPCRRMDISRLLVDSGIGHRHYAIIEQGKISHVVESKPDDIRALIEEAAGITKFKLKKKAALRKIELTRQNLLRLGDIIAEVSRQLSSLKRQAQRANRYRSLKKEIKRLEIIRALHNYGQWRQELERLENDLRSSRDAQSERAAELAKLDAELTGRSSEIHQLEETLQQSREALFQTKNTISSDENSLLHLQRQTQEMQERQQRLSQEILEQEKRQEQQGLEKDRLAKAQRELAEAYSRAEVIAHRVADELNQEKARLNRLIDQLDVGKGDLVELLGEIARVRNNQSSGRNRLEDLDRRKARGDREYLEFKERFDQLQPQRQQVEKKISGINDQAKKLGVETNKMHKDISEHEQARNRCAKEIATLESTYHQEHSQLQVLLEMESSYAWFNDAVRALLSAREEKELHCSIRGAVAEMLEVDGSHRRAVEAVLGGRLQALVVDSLADACAALEHLKRTGTGRSHFIALSVAHNVPKTEAKSDAPVPLANLVSPRPGYESIINLLLSKVMYCTDLQEALSWWESHPNDSVLVTAEGDVVAQDGTLWGGSRDQQISILGKQEERKTLGAKVASSAETLKTKRQQFHKIEQQLARIKSRLQTIQEEQQELRNQLLQQEKEYYRSETEQQKFAERLSLLDLEKAHAEQEMAELEMDLGESARELERLEERKRDLEEVLEETKHQRLELEDKVDSLQEQATAQQVSVAALEEKMEASRSSYQRLHEYHTEGDHRLQQLREDMESSRQKMARLTEEQEETRKRLHQAHSRLLEQERLLRTEEDHWREFEDHQRELEARRVQLLQQDKKLEQEIQGMRQEIAEFNLKIQYLLHQTQENYHLDLRTETTVPPEEPPDFERLEKKLQKLRDRVARIGEVNLTAIEEYDEQQERHAFLTAQRDDLVQSLDGLKKAISRINRTTRRRFLKTLEAVNRKLSEVFPLLFNGGSGHLQLLTDRDPLEAGIEILVHPPGKRLTSMSLLSGGEKALAAAALLFSLYMIRPSPFCILDEVDAPLDEANIDRFTQLLKTISQDSQIIMVTHNKRTMEISDLLLGVTMEQPGISKIMAVNFKDIPETHG
jgi:chromosome segregation protein